MNICFESHRSIAHVLLSSDPIREDLSCLTPLWDGALVAILEIWDVLKVAVKGKVEGVENYINMPNKMRHANIYIYIYNIHLKK